MTKEEIRFFVKFLKKNNKYDEFRFYVNSPKHFGNCDRQNYVTLKKYMNDVLSYNVLQSAFFWTTTLEGDKFWRRLNEVYRNKLNILRTNNG